MAEREHNWVYGVSPKAKQDQLKVYVDALRGLADAGLTAGSVIAHFHHRRVLPLMERKLRLYQMTTDALPEGTKISKEALLDELVLHRAKHTVDKLPPPNVLVVLMRPERGYLQFVSPLAQVFLLISSCRPCLFSSF